MLSIASLIDRIRMRYDAATYRRASSSGIAQDVSQDLVSHSLLSGEVVTGFSVDGNRAARWELQVDGQTVLSMRTTSSSLSRVVNLPSRPVVSEGQVVNLRVTNESVQGQLDAHGTLFISDGN